MRLAEHASSVQGHAPDFSNVTMLLVPSVPKTVPLPEWPKNLPADEFTAQQNHPTGAWV
jgi:hypothetical protein